MTPKASTSTTPEPSGFDVTQPSTDSIEESTDEDEEAPHYFSFDKAVNEVFRFLPEEVCPRISTSATPRFEGFMDAAADPSAAQHFHLPMPPAVRQLVSSLESASVKHDVQGWD